MSVDKRRDTTEPLTEHDVAERLSNALLRVWRIVADLNDDPELAALVRHSRFLVVQPIQIREVLTEFDRVTGQRASDLPEEKPTYQQDDATSPSTGSQQ